MTTKSLPAAVTTLDLLKTFAVICMIIDHIGFYFFPDASWFRVVGRLGGAPIWFFLIGYAQSRDIPNKWMIGALILAVMDFALFSQVFPMNVLVTLMALRLFIDPLMNVMMRSRYLFWLISILLAFFYMATNGIVEYGTLGLLCGVYGYITRHRERLKIASFLSDRDYFFFIGFLIVANTLLQSAVMGFDTVQSTVLAVLFAVITVSLSQLKVQELSQEFSRSMTRLLHFGGRKTLEIYVGHLVVFKLVFWALYLMGFYR